MTMQRSKAFGLFVLLGMLGLGIWLGGAVAQEPEGFIIGAALRSRLLGQVQGPWVGQAGSRAYVMPGELLEYLVYYGNNGPALAQATLVDYLPIWCELISVDHPGASYDAQNHRMALELGGLGAGAMGIVHIVARVMPDAPAATPLVNVVQLWDPTGLADESSAAPPVVVQAPQIEVTLSGPAAFRHNQDADYTLTYANRGNLGTRGLTLSWVLPEGFYPLSYLGQPAWITPSLVLSDALSLAPDESRSQMLRVHVLPVARARPRLPVTCTVRVSGALPTGATFVGEGESAGLIQSGLVYLSPFHGGSRLVPTPTPTPVVVTYCGSTEDYVYRVDGSLFRAYESDSASASSLRHITVPPAPSGWNQPWFSLDSAWRPAAPVWFRLWDAPAWSPRLNICVPIGLLAQDGQFEGVDGTTYLYRRTFTLAPPFSGTRIISATLSMWSDNKSAWWWQGQSIAYDRETNIGTVELYPGYIAAEGGVYVLAVQDSNDITHALNPQGIAYRLSVTWGYGASQAAGDQP